MDPAQGMMTGMVDRNGIVIRSGDTVIHREGWRGTVKFVNGAWRYDIKDDGKLLAFNSSLLYSEHNKPTDFCVS